MTCPVHLHSISLHFYFKHLVSVQTLIRRKSSWFYRNIVASSEFLPWQKQNSWRILYYTNIFPSSDRFQATTPAALQPAARRETRDTERKKEDREVSLRLTEELLLFVFVLSIIRVWSQFDSLRKKGKTQGTWIITWICVSWNELALEMIHLLVVHVVK